MTGNRELRRWRKEIERGLARAGLAAFVALLVVMALACDPQGDFFVAAHAEPAVEVRRWSDGKSIASLPSFGPDKPSMSFSPDGRLLAVQMGQGQGTLAVWEWRTARLVLKIPTTGAAWYQPNFEFSPDSRELFVVSADGPLRHLDLVAGRELAPLAAGAPASLISVSRDGRLIAIAHGNEARVLDRETGRWGVRRVLPGEISSLAIHPNGERLAFGCFHLGAFVWDADGDQSSRLSHQAWTVTRVFFNREGDLLAASGWGDGTTLWDMSTLRPLLTTLDGFAIQFAAGGRRLAFGRERIALGLWEFLPAAAL